jgi:NAD(P)-dependent dehydrogenase (short-subunit alcohol dehydrogenase family)
MGAAVSQLFEPDVLRGEVSFVTGASSGLGRDIAMILARAGWWRGISLAASSTSHRSMASEPA